MIKKILNNEKKDLTDDSFSNIGAGVPFIIAEIGTNHDRDLDRAKSMIHELANTGCDCVKFQIYEPYEIVSKKILAKDYGLENVYGNISAIEMFEEYLKTPKEWFPELIELAHSLGLKCAATIHGDDGVEWIKGQGFDFVKIASMDHTNIPLLEKIVDNLNIPVLMSFGMAMLEDIDRAVKVLKRHKSGVVLFYCVAVYPPEPGEISLRNITFLSKRYGLPVGFSDHTIENNAACAALALGSNIFEKHVTYDRKAIGPDHPFALEFSEFAEYVKVLHETSALLGSENFNNLSAREMNNRENYLKSVIVKHDMKKGDSLKSDDLYLARPGIGIEPRYLKTVIDSKLSRDISAEQPLQWEDIGGSKPFES